MSKLINDNITEAEYNPFDAPIAGQSLTDEPGNYPWEHPPRKTDPEVIFKAIMQAHGVSTAQANEIFTNVYLPQIERDNLRSQFGY